MEGAVLYVIMFATETNLLSLERTRLNAKMVFNINRALDKLHAMIIKLVSDLLYLLTLE